MRARIAGVRPVTIALYALPFATVAVVSYALFGVGASRPYAGARLYGGPTENAARLSWRLAAVERYRAVESALGADSGEFTVEARFDDGTNGRWTGKLDALGTASVLIVPPRGAVRAPIDVRVSRGADERAETLAHGRVWLPIADWLSRAKRHGGWIAVPSKGELSLRVATARGALAVPFSDAIWIEVRRAGEPVAGAKVHVEPEGMNLVRPSGRASFETNAEGRVTVMVAPLEHNVALGVIAEHGSARARWYGSLPVVPGAFSATLEGTRLRIESPVVREVAFYALISERARIAGGAAVLEPDSRGGAATLIDVGPLPDGPIWAEVSSDPELATDTTVGWPLRVSATAAGDPATSLEVPDRLLLDGLAIGERAEADRRSLARLIAGIFTVVALALVAVIVVVRAKIAGTRLRVHLEAAGADAESRDRIARERAGVRIVVAVLCIALGFAVIALVALYRLS